MPEVGLCNQWSLVKLSWTGFYLSSVSIAADAVFFAMLGGLRVIPAATCRLKRELDFCFTWHTKGFGCTVR